MRDIEFTVTINITDKKEFQSSAGNYGCDAGDSIETMVERVVVAPDNPPLDHGYEIVTVKAKAQTDERFEILIILNVTDEQAMIKEARECYEGAWQDSDWKPASIGEAAYELLCASNERPGPDALGFEFVTEKYLKDRPVNPEFLSDEAEFASPGI